MKKYRAGNRSPLFSLFRSAFAIHNKVVQEGLPLAEAMDAHKETLDISRRDFLKSGLAATGTVAIGTLIGRTSYAKWLVKGPSPSIAIIGAGAAGLSAAWYLKKKGLTATIYEASSRTGGRIFTAKNIMAPGLTTELGGEFIDSGHEELLQLAKELHINQYLDLEFISETALQKEAYFFNKQHHTEREIITEFQPFAEAIKKNLAALPQQIDHTTEGIAKELDSISIEEYLNRNGIGGVLYKLLDSAYLTEYGEDIGNQSALNLITLLGSIESSSKAELFGASDEHYKIKGGNQRLTDALAAKFANQTRLDYQLEAIKETGNKYTLTFQQKNGASKEINADIVLITIPFSLLRDVHIDVPMAEQKREAISSLSYGSNTKLMMGTTNRLWRDQGYTGYTFTDEAFQTGWDNSQLQQGKAGGYTILLGGGAGRAACSGTAQAQIQEFLPGLNAAYPGFDQNLNGKVERFAWPEHKYTKGSYAYYRPGQWTSIGGLEKEPVGNIFFAGEHCSYEYQGFMNGAVQTGKQAAEVITALVTSPKKAKVLQAK